MEKVFGWFSAKNAIPQQYIEFLDLISATSKTLDPTMIGQCAIQYIDLFFSISEKDFLSLPIAKEIVLMLSFMIPHYCQHIRNNNENRAMFQCIEHSLSIIPKKSDVTEIYSNLLFTILGSNKEGLILSSEKMFKKLLLNVNFLEFIIKDENIIKIYTAKPQLSLQFTFLHEAIDLGSLASQKQYFGTIQAIESSISSISSHALGFIAAFYRKIGQCSHLERLMDHINERALIGNSCDFYSDLLKIPTEVPNLMSSKFIELCQMASPSIVPSLIHFISIHKEFDQTISSFFVHMKSLSNDDQILFLSIVSRQKNELREQLILRMFPPWKFGLNCFVLTDFVNKYMNSNEIQIPLMTLLAGTKLEEISYAFDQIQGFHELIHALFMKADDEDSIPLYFNKLSYIACSGHESAIKGIDSLCRIYPPVTYKDSLLKDLPDLILVKSFAELFPNMILDLTLLRVELLEGDFVKKCLSYKLFDALAALSIDGPHPVIDHAIIQYFEESNRIDASPEVLEKLAYGVFQENSLNTGAIRIPSLIPHIGSTKFRSLFDRYVAGKYLIENKIVGKNDVVLAEIGVQFLTREIANSLIDIPDVLMSLTNPQYPHQSVFQFQIGREDSYISLTNIPFQFDFWIDDFIEPFIVFTIGSNIFRCEGSLILFNDKSFKINYNSWNKVSIDATSGIEVLINKKEAFRVVNSKENILGITIGSRISAPFSTFYIKKAFYTLPKTGSEQLVSYQTGIGVLDVGYNGFALQAPFINAIPRLLHKLLQSNNCKEFSYIFISLLNIARFENISIKLLDFLGIMRVCLVQKFQFASESLFERVLKFICRDDSVDWDSFQRFFIDYSLWSKCYSSMKPVINHIIAQMQFANVSYREIEKLSLVHFFIDLSIFGQIGGNLFNEMIYLICRKHPDIYSSIRVHILNRETSPIIRYLMDRIPDLLSSIPIKFAPQIAPNLFIPYFRSYSLLCCTKDGLFDVNTINRLVPYFAQFVVNIDFWISMFILITNTPHDKLSMFRTSPMEREIMLHSFFVLLCILFKSNSENSDKLCFSVLDVLLPIIMSKNIPMIDYLNELKDLIHFAIKVEEFVLMPINFGSLFEPCRMPSNEDENKDKTDHGFVPEFDLGFQAPSSGYLLPNNDFWFGVPPDPFLLAMDGSVKAYVDSLENQQELKNDIEQTSEESKRILESIAHSITKQIAIYTLSQLSGHDLSLALEHLTIFGADVDHRLSLIVHQNIILGFLEQSSVSCETLEFIQMVVCVGWWENRLTDLFNVLCSSFDKYRGDSQNPAIAMKRWSLFGRLIQSILALSVDLTGMKISVYSSILFHPILLKEKDYFLFLCHIFMSDSFISSSQSQNVWMSLISSSSELDSHILNTIFVDVFENSDITPYQQFATLITETQILTKVLESKQIPYSLLRGSSFVFFNNYLTEMCNKMSSFNDSIKNIRRKLIGTLNDSIEGDILAITQFTEKTNKCIRLIEKQSFEIRFNITSHENERSSYHLWCILPSQVPTRYQLCPTVHPISVPTLYVPLGSSIEIDTFKSYSRYSSRTTTSVFGEIVVNHSYLPPYLEQYISQPFFKLSQNLYHDLFKVSFKHYGKISTMMSVNLIFGTMRIKCALVFAERGFYLVTEARVTENGSLLLKTKKENLAVITFLDSVSSKYYGSCSLFYGHCVLFFSRDRIMNTVKRNYCHQPTAVEIWFSRGFSLYIVFNSTHARQTFFDSIQFREHFPKLDSMFGPSFSERICNISNNKNNLNSLLSEWQHGILSSFMYLLCLNFLSDRSFSNYCQYPVMPWLIGRDLTKPMGQQTSERAAQFNETFRTSGPDFHFYGSHYSSAAVVMHFLMRIQPFSNLHMELHDGFDHKDRLFYSIEKEWQSSSQYSSHNVEELIPELFQVPEVFTNINTLPLPINSKQDNLDNVKLPEGFNTVSFIKHMRDTLEKSQDLEAWIDLIFGVNSRGENAASHLNLFYPTTYGIRAKLAEDDKAFEQMMRCFGQTPTQLFTEPHPSRSSVFLKTKPLLVDSSNFFTQIINSGAVDTTNPIVVFANNTFVVDSCTNVYSQLSHSSSIKYSDGLIQWNAFPLDLISTSSFSIEKLLYCAVYPSGIMQINRAKCDKNGIINGYYPLTSCSLPSHILNTIPVKFSCCAISSHHFVACEATGNILYTFHVGTGLFIRSIQCKSEIRFVQIDDSFCCFYIFCSHSIEVYTINGTFVASCECDSEITSSSISCNDISVFAATSHSDNTIRFWNTDPSISKVQCINVVSSPLESIIAIDLIRGGSVLVAVSILKKAIVITTNGVGTGILPKSDVVTCCAKCKKKNSHLSECSSCGLYYCPDCRTDVGGTICISCMDLITDNTNIIEF